MVFPSLENFDHVVVPVSIYFSSNSQWGALFCCIAYDYSCANCHDHLRDAPWEDIFKISASAAASELCEWVHIAIDVYIPHRKYQVKPHSSPWFSAACATAIGHRNHFLPLYQQNKSFESKVKFRQASNCCKRILEPAQIAYANKTKVFITSQKLGSQDFWWTANSAVNKGKLAIPPLFNVPEIMSCIWWSKMLAENFSKNSNLDYSNISLLVFCNSQDCPKSHNEPWFVKGIWSWLYSNSGSKRLWAWTFLYTSWTLQYVSEGVLFSRLLEGFIGGPYI